MNFILQVDEALVFHTNKGFKYPTHGHATIPHRDLTLLVLEVREILHVYVKQAGAGFMDGLNDVRARANCVPDINAAADTRVHILHRFQNSDWGRPQFVFRTVIVDGDADVVFLCEFLDARKSLRGGVARDDNGNPRTLAVFELAAYVRILVLCEIDDSGAVKFDARCSIVGESNGLSWRIRGEMILDVLGVQRRHI